MSVFAADVCSFFLCVRSANVGFTFLRWNFEAGSIFLSSMMLFKRFEFSINRNLTELCTTPAWAVFLVQRNVGCSSNVTVMPLRYRCVKNFPSITVNYYTDILNVLNATYKSRIFAKLGSKFVL